MKNVFNELKEEMERQHIKGYTLSKKADIAASDLYAALNGTRPMFPKWRKRIAEVLNVPEEQIFPKGGTPWII